MFSFRFWLLLALCVVIGYFGWRFFAPAPSGGPPRDMQVPPVRVAVARVQDVPWFLNGLGTVQPSADVVVQSRVEGQLVALHFSEGQRVEAGDLLAEIDPRPFEANLAQARAKLEQDRALLANAERDLARYARLVKGDYIAEQQYQTQQSQVRQYRAQVQADQAAVDSAALQLDYSRIKAPVSGRLGLRNVDVGNQIKPGDANGLVRLSETTPCDVLFTLPEIQGAQVAAALRRREQDPSIPPLLVQAWDRSDRELLATGELISLDNKIDSATGTISLKARFANSDHVLFPNQFVNARVLVQVLGNVVTVPTAAVQLGSKGSYCYLAQKEDGREVAIFREIVPGARVGEITVIESGVAGGDEVVVDGLDRLRNDLPIRIASTIETPAVSAESAGN